MPKKTEDEWGPDDRGRYRRKVGWTIDEGQKKPSVFYFGTNLDQAKGRLIRVKELWSHLETMAAEPIQSSGSLPSPLTERQLKWDSESLWIARTLADGRVQVVVERVGQETPDVYALRISRLGKRYPMVYFLPEDAEFMEAGKAFWQKAAEHQLAEIKQMPVNVVKENSETLHQALDSYVAHIRAKVVEPTDGEPQLTSYGNLRIEQALRIKERQKDMPLSKLDLEACQSLLDYWRNRPKLKNSTRAIANRTCVNHIRELIRFFRWLSKSKDFAWRKPEDFDELEMKVKDLPEERTDIGFLQVKVYSLDHLAKLYRYATPMERLLMLLGLNCGFKGAEQGTLLLDHLFVDRPHPHQAMLLEIAKFRCEPDDRFILYSRNKTKVYGEFLLWPQTSDGLRWATERRNAICNKLGTDKRNVLLTRDGLPFFRQTEGNKNRSQIFTNKWSALLERIRKDHPEFPRYSFSTLRDTGANLIRNIADGEVSALYLCHGQPVKKDQLLELYTNRPFGKLFVALRKLGEELKPVFDAGPKNPWTQPPQQYTSLGKREEVMAMHKTGVSPENIAEIVKLSKATIYRIVGKDS